MTLFKSLLPGLLLLLAPFLNVHAQPKQTLLHSDPEAQGVSSAGILQFLDAASKSKTEFHSIMLLRHGHIIAEGWWKPYASDLRHSMYSVSKSFTATAVGFAVSEHRLSVDDKVISFFPDQLPDTVSPYLADLRVKDLLSMSGGDDPDPTFSVIGKDSNWVRAFLALPIVHKPGTHFLYNTLGTFMLAAIVQKVTGEKLIDYLKPRLFDPLGIEGEDWEIDPEGINTGGWGLRIRTEDMARFGQLFLQKGKWNGKQILSEKWIEEATTTKIIQHPDLPQVKKDSSDWEQGYCYQMWRCRHDAFRADGAFGQFIIVMPAQDAVLAITAETPDMQNEINLVWKYLLPAFHKEKLPADKKNETALKQKLAALKLASGSTHNTASPWQSRISGKTFVMAPNSRNIQSVSFRFDGKKCVLALKTDTANYDLDFGSGNWERGETSKRGPNLVSPAKFNFLTFRSTKVAGTYRWKNDTTLELTMQYIESPHHETSVCHFDGNKMSMSVENSFDFGNRKVEMQGEMKD